MTEDVFDPLDIHFARFMTRLDGGSSTAVLAAALLASRATRLGHVCFPLAEEPHLYKPIFLYPEYV